MTIKHQDKNISAENNITQLFDIEVERNNDEIIAVNLTRKDFYTDEDKTTIDLMDYFYTEQEIDNFVRIHLVVYDSYSQLPQRNGVSAGKSNYIYLVPFTDSEGIKEGIYKEYVWVKIKNSDNYRTNESDHNDYILDGDHYNYETIGSTEIDLSQIRQDILDLQNNKLDKSKVVDNLTTSTYSASDPTALSAKQGKYLNDNKINKSDIATNLTTNDDIKVLSAKQGKVLQDNKVDKTSIVDNLTTDDNTKVLSAKQGKILRDNVEEIIDDLNEEELFILSNKNIGQTGDQINLKALFYGEYTPTQQLSLVSQNSLTNNLTVNSDGFEVISGDGFSITNNGGSLSNNDHVECTIPINLSSNTVYINFKCKSNDGTTALYGDIDSHGFNSEYNTGMFIDSTGLEFFDSTASLPNNLNLNDWIDVKVEITPTSQKVYINNTLQITKAMIFDSTAYNNTKYFSLWAPSVDFSIKDFYIEVNDALQTSSGCFLSTNYTCTGAGKKEFVAKYGTVVSQPITVWDTLFYDNAIYGDKNSNWTTGANITVTPTSDGTIIKSSNCNSTTGAYITVPTFTGDFEVSVKVNVENYATTWGAYIGTVVPGQGNAITQIRQSGWREIKFRRVNGVYSCEMREIGGSWSNVTVDNSFSSVGAVNFRIHLYTGNNTEHQVSYKDLKIYSI